MKYKFLLWLLLVASICDAQIAAVVSAGTNNRNSQSTEKTYVEVPSPPSFTSPATITDAVGSSVESGEISGATDVLIAENATPGLFNNRLRPNGISGIRFKSATGRIKVGNTVSASQQVIAPLTGSDNLSYYHLHVVGNPSSAVTGISGINHLASAGGTTVYFEDIVIENTGFACAQINQSTDGLKYASITLAFVRGFGYNTEGEGFYIGSTNKAANRSKIDYLSMYHCYATDKYRDGLQITWAKIMEVSNITIYNCGLGPLPANAGQNRLFQIHNSNGYVNNSIFHATYPNTAQPGEVFAHGVTFDNGYIEWAVDEPIYIGDLESSSYGPNGTNEYATRDSIIFEDYIFAPSVDVANLFEIHERNAPVMIRNCTFNSHVLNVVSDQRGGSPGNTITIVNPTYADVPTVTYKNHDVNDYDNHGRVTSNYHYYLGLGAFTPTP
jgi:hypothetical protein